MPTNRRSLQALLLACVLAGSGVGMYAALRPDLVPKNFGIVVPGKLYRSGELTPAATKKVVGEHGIRTIIDLGAYDKDPVGEKLARRTAKALGVTRHVFRLEGDARGNPNAYVEALRLITDPTNQPVLVHCSAGAQRTSACIVLYRELVEGRTRAEAMPEAYAHEHDPKKNPHLTPYLDENERAIGEAFRAGDGVLIPRHPKAELEPVPD